MAGRNLFANDQTTQGRNLFADEPVGAPPAPSSPPPDASPGFMDRIGSAFGQHIMGQVAPAIAGLSSSAEGFMNLAKAMKGKPLDVEIKADLPPSGEGARQLAATMAGGAVGEVAGGVAGIAATPFGSDVAADVVRSTQGAFTPELGTEGQQFAQDARGYIPDAVAGTIAEIPNVMDEYGDATLDATGSPLLASVVRTLPVAAGLAAGPMAGRAVKAIPAMPRTVSPEENALVSGLSQREIAGVKLPGGRSTGFGEIDGGGTVPGTGMTRGTAPGASADPQWGAKGTPITTSSGQPGMAGAGTVKDKAGIAAMKQGATDRSVANVKVATPATRKTMRDMVRTLEKTTQDEALSIGMRASDHVGDALMKRVRIVMKVKRDAGDRLYGIAKGLEGTPTNFASALDKFVESMGQLGVKINAHRTRAELKEKVPLYEISQNSPIKGITGLEDEFAGMMKKLASVDVSHGFGLHQLKQFISEKVSYGQATQSGLSGGMESAFKALRHDINKSLQDISPAYKEVNTNYSQATQSLGDLQRLAGLKNNPLTSPETASGLGTLSRRLTSNAQTRNPLRIVMRDIEKLALKHSQPGKGMVVYSAAGKPRGKAAAQLTDEIDRLVIFANTLEDMFGTSATNSLAGQVAQPLAKAARDSVATGATAQAIDLGLLALSKAKGVNETNAFKALRGLLNDGN